MLNWINFPMFLTLDDNALLERVQARSIAGTEVPSSVLKEDGGSAFWSSSYWMPEQASTFAPQVDFLFMGIFWISAFFFIGIIGTMCYFVFKYRRKGKEINPLPSPSHNTGIEILWSVLPSILLAWMFYEGTNGYFEMRVPREVEEEIQVRATQYNWEFTYPDGDKSNELHLVRDRPTMMVMSSGDVLHSLYVPAFRQKMDCVPGRFTYFFVTPTKEGTFRLVCTEYCGNEHSEMKSIVKVHKDDATRKASTEWIKAEHAPWEFGQRLYQINCSGCHRIDGQSGTGPALNLTWGLNEQVMADGRRVKVDRDYIRKSIEYPNDDIVAGYGANMPSFKGKLGDEEINAIIQFLKYLDDPTSVSSEPIGDNPITDGSELTEIADSNSAESDETEAADEIND